MADILKGHCLNNHRSKHTDPRAGGSAVRWTHQSGDSLKIWQGWKESNLRMPESKSGALTNLATPLHRIKITRLYDTYDFQPINRYFLENTANSRISSRLCPSLLPTGQRMCLQIAAFADFPGSGSVRNFRFLRQMRKYSTSRASHSSLKPCPGKPVKRLANWRA